MYLEAAWLMVRKGAELYDSGLACGAEANSAKFLGARAGHDACWQAIATLGGFGYAREYHVERLYREVASNQIGRANVCIQSLMRISYAVFCLTQKNIRTQNQT